MNQDAFKALQEDAQVPEYLKKALLSEIDIVRDTMQIVEMFTEGFFSTALLFLAETHKS